MDDLCHTGELCPYISPTTLDLLFPNVKAKSWRNDFRRGEGIGICLLKYGYTAR